VFYDGESFWGAGEDRRAEMKRRFGVLYQSGALWSSMTLAENVELPLAEYTRFSAEERREIASLKLSLVGLAGFEEFYPSEISGGMQKRAGLARAFVVVTHELQSIFTIADDSIFVDAEARTMTARGNPRWLREHCEVPKVRAFLNRGAGEAPAVSHP
jgi:phospholipid/cholesterol/gamma-HCH transport system ATP-binding protein